MAEVEVIIGDRTYTVACNPGEEKDVQAAAKELNIEAQNILGGIGKVPEVKLLLMAGLMLGGRFNVLESESVNKDSLIKSLETQAKELIKTNELMKSQSHDHAVDTTTDITEKPELSKKDCKIVLESILDNLEKLLVLETTVSEESKDETENISLSKEQSDQKELF